MFIFNFTEGKRGKEVICSSIIDDCFDSFLFAFAG